MFFPDKLGRSTTATHKDEAGRRSRGRWQRDLSQPGVQTEQAAAFDRDRSIRTRNARKTTAEPPPPPGHRRERTRNQIARYRDGDLLRLIGASCIRTDQVKNCISGTTTCVARAAKRFFFHLRTHRRRRAFDKFSASGPFFSVQFYAQRAALNEFVQF